MQMLLMRLEVFKTVPWVDVHKKFKGTLTVGFMRYESALNLTKVSKSSM